MVKHVKDTFLGMGFVPNCIGTFFTQIISKLLPVFLKKFKINFVYFSKMGFGFQSCIK